MSSEAVDPDDEPAVSRQLRDLYSYGWAGWQTDDIDDECVHDQITHVWRARNSRGGNKRLHVDNAAGDGPLCADQLADGILDRLQRRAVECFPYGYCEFCKMCLVMFAEDNPGVRA